MKNVKCIKNKYNIISLYIQLNCVLGDAVVV